MSSPTWVVGFDPRFDEDLRRLAGKYAAVEAAWRGVKWAAARDPFQSSIETPIGLRARTTRAAMGVPNLVWFFVVGEEQRCSAVAAFGFVFPGGQTDPEVGRHGKCRSLGAHTRHSRDYA